MARIMSKLLLVSAVVALGGCSVAADALWPSLTGRDPSGRAPQSSQIPPSAGETSGQPTVSLVGPPPLGRTSFAPPNVTPGQPTGTFVGQKVVQMRSELQRLQSDINAHNGHLQQIRGQTRDHSTRYHTSIAAINSRLQVGTTPGNPILVNQWNQAQHELAQIDSDIAQMNQLANNVSATSTLSAYLLETARATYGLSGAVEEDHRQLSILEDEVNRTVVLIDRLLNELSEDINRQTVYLGGERGNLISLSLAIKNGEMLGTSLSNRAFLSAAPAASAASGQPPPPAAALSALPGQPGQPRRPLVVIRFDRPNVSYQQAVYTAVSRALERRPNAAFDLVAVAPNKGTPAQVTLASNASKRNAESVLRSLTEMGLPLDRIRLSSLTSAGADANEVHLYVR